MSIRDLYFLLENYMDAYEHVVLNARFDDIIWHMWDFEIHKKGSYLKRWQ